MTISLTTFDCTSFTTDAKFRAWGTAVNAAFTAAGLTNTADTGQINWTTVTKPTSAFTAKGYEIWRFNDTLQSTKPIFFKVSYAAGGNASGNNAEIRITLGTGSNGSGTITGVGSSLVEQTGSGGNDTNAGSNAAQKIGVSYSTTAGALSIVIDYMAAGFWNSGVFSICRTCDASGAPTGDGVHMTTNYGSTAGGTTTYSANYNTNTNMSNAITGVPAGYLQTGSYSSGNTVALLRHYALIAPPFGVNGSVSYLNADIPAWSTFTASPFGASHTYLALGTTAFTKATFNSSTSFAAAFLWE